MSALRRDGERRRFAGLGSRVPGRSEGWELALLRGGRGDRGPGGRDLVVRVGTLRDRRRPARDAPRADPAAACAARRADPAARARPRPDRAATARAALLPLRRGRRDAAPRRPARGRRRRLRHPRAGATGRRGRHRAPSSRARARSGARAPRAAAHAAAPAPARPPRHGGMIRRRARVQGAIASTRRRRTRNARAARATPAPARATRAQSAARRRACNSSV